MPHSIKVATLGGRVWKWGLYKHAGWTLHVPPWHGNLRTSPPRQMDGFKPAVDHDIPCGNCVLKCTPKSERSGAWTWGGGPWVAILTEWAPSPSQPNATFVSESKSIFQCTNLSAFFSLPTCVVWTLERSEGECRHWRRGRGVVGHPRPPRRGNVSNSVFLHPPTSALLVSSHNPIF
jgi:hypothetical protein